MFELRVRLALGALLLSLPVMLRAQAAAPGDLEEAIGVPVLIAAQPAAPAPADDAEGAALPASQPAEGEKIAAPAPAPGGPAPDWFDRAKNPVTWLKWGADLRIRWEFYNNAHTLNSELAGAERSYYRQRTRLWTTLSPCENLDINARLAWEFRSFAQPEEFNPAAGRGFRSTDMDEVLFDNLNLKFKNVLGQPKGGDSLDVTVGRQDIIFGDGWLVLDGTPMDGSRTIFFDAARATYNARSAHTTVDLVYIDQHVDSDWWIEPFNHREYERLSNQDEQGAILYVSNKSIKDTQIDGYFIYKHDELAAGHTSKDPTFKTLTVGEQGDIYTFGFRGVHDFDRHWQARGEIASEFGNKNAQDLCALGANGKLIYAVGDRLDNKLRMTYEYLSGDDPDTKGKNEGWDPLWGRWPQYSEIFAVTSGLDTGRPAFYTNMHRFGPGWSIKPCGKDGPLEFLLDYYLMFAPEEHAASANFNDGEHFRGQLVTALLRYQFNKHVSGHLQGEYFKPGDFYSSSRDDAALFLRWELMFTW